ncbi:MAG: hypothetical protein LBO04_00865 [Spirochaetaceae bacterium]|nr:hypothetical protein [Spirochaetaceae bacterium]
MAEADFRPKIQTGQGTDGAAGTGRGYCKGSRRAAGVPPVRNGVRPHSGKRAAGAAFFAYTPFPPPGARISGIIHPENRRSRHFLPKPNPPRRVRLP